MRRFFLPLLALGLALPAAAQTTYGVRAGLNVSDFVGFDDGDVEVIELSPTLGFVGGVFAEVPLSPRLAIRPEVLYTQKGFKVDVPEFLDPGNDLDTDFDVDYIEVPVLARIGVPLSQTLDAGLLLGPTFAFKVNESTGDFDEEIVGGTVEDVFESFDLGIALGLEVGSGPFYVDLRYTPGLLDVIQDDQGADDPSIRNSVFSVTGTFKFGR